MTKIADGLNICAGRLKSYWKGVGFKSINLAEGLGWLLVDEALVSIWPSAKSIGSSSSTSDMMASTKFNSTWVRKSQRNGPEISGRLRCT